MESVERRLARIEAAIFSLQEKIEDRNRTFDKILQPLVSQVTKHKISLALLKRDRFWLFTLCGAAFTLALCTLKGLH